jgi:preprotein translocase subunit SecE
MVSAFSKALLFLKEVLGEIKKIVWPTRSELIGASIVVCLFAIFCAVILGLMDSGCASAIKYVIGG